MAGVATVAVNPHVVPQPIAVADVNPLVALQRLVANRLAELLRIAAMTPAVTRVAAADCYLGFSVEVVAADAATVVARIPVDAIPAANQHVVLRQRVAPAVTLVAVEVGFWRGSSADATADVTTVVLPAASPHAALQPIAVADVNQHVALQPIAVAVASQHVALQPVAVEQAHRLSQPRQLPAIQLRRYHQRR